MSSDMNNNVNTNNIEGLVVNQRPLFLCCSTKIFSKLKTWMERYKFTVYGSDLPLCMQQLQYTETGAISIVKYDCLMFVEDLTWDKELFKLVLNRVIDICSVNQFIRTVALYALHDSQLSQSYLEVFKSHQSSLKLPSYLINSSENGKIKLNEVKTLLANCLSHINPYEIPYYDNVENVNTRVYMGKNPPSLELNLSTDNEPKLTKDSYNELSIKSKMLRTQDYLNSILNKNNSFKVFDGYSNDKTKQVIDSVMKIMNNSVSLSITNDNLAVTSEDSNVSKVSHKEMLVSESLNKSKELYKSTDEYKQLIQLKDMFELSRHELNQNQISDSIKTTIGNNISHSVTTIDNLVQLNSMRTSLVVFNNSIDNLDKLYTNDLSQLAEQYNDLQSKIKHGDNISTSDTSKVMINTLNLERAKILEQANKSHSSLMSMISNFNIFEQLAKRRFVELAKKIKSDVKANQQSNEYQKEQIVSNQLIVNNLNIAVKELTSFLNNKNRILKGLVNRSCNVINLFRDANTIADMQINLLSKQLEDIKMQGAVVSIELSSKLAPKLVCILGADRTGKSSTALSLAYINSIGSSKHKITKQKVALLDLNFSNHSLKYYVKGTPHDTLDNLIKLPNKQAHIENLFNSSDLCIVENELSLNELCQANNCLEEDLYNSIIDKLKLLANVCNIYTILPQSLGHLENTILNECGKLLLIADENVEVCDTTKLIVQHLHDMDFKGFKVFVGNKRSVANSSWDIVSNNGISRSEFRIKYIKYLDMISRCKIDSKIPSSINSVIFNEYSSIIEHLD